MALRAVPEHPKFAQLQFRLSLEKYEALGILEATWHFTGRFAPQGNVGKYSDEAIAKWIGWKGDPEALINALVEAGWLDRNEAYRLITHDWHMHADHATRLSLKRGRLTFCMSDGPTPDLHRTHTGPTPEEQSPKTDDGVPPVEGLPEAGAGAGAEAGAGKKTKAPAKAKPLPDPRANEFRAAFQDAFNVANGIQAPWDAKEATNLSRFLKANPSITGEQWRHILYHRSISPLNQKASLSTWVARALAWLDAPADEWGKPINGGNRSGYGNRGQSRTDGNLQALRRAIGEFPQEDVDGTGGSAPGRREHRDAEPVLTGVM